MPHPIVINLLAALAGWLAYNMIVFSMHKDEHEATFNLKSYIREYYDNWLASLFVIPVLLFFGYKGLGLGVVDMEHLKWSDAYYVCAGFATELIKNLIAKWKANNPK